MKTNMGKVFVAFLCMMMCLSLNAQDLTPGMVVGMWNFSAPDAPYGYQEGTCQIKKTGEDLSAVFTISGTEMTVKEIKKENNSYKCNFYVDGTYVSLLYSLKQSNPSKLDNPFLSMFTVIGIMFAGIAAGYLLRKIELLQKIGRPISYTILLLLFLLGISVGANKEIVDNLATLGSQAFLLALASTAGSVLAGWGVYHLFFKERSRG